MYHVAKNEFLKLFSVFAAVYNWGKMYGFVIYNRCLHIDTIKHRLIQLIFMIINLTFRLDDHHIYSDFEQPV